VTLPQSVAAMSDRPHSLPPHQWLPPVAPEPVPTADPVPPTRGERRERRDQTPPARGRGGAVLALLLAAAAKGKALLVLLPKLKLLTTSGSMLVSVAAYSLIWGWRFAAGFVLLLLVHELGHVIQLRREGIPASAPLFIPFLGAVVGAKSLGDDAAAEARVGLAGPVLGTIGAGAVALAGWWLGSDLLLALAFTGFFLNLFNLLPVTPLDGGRAFAAMAPWMWFVGLGLIVGLCFWRPNPIILLIALFAVLDVWRRWGAYRSGDPAARDYYRVTPRQRAAVAAMYLGLVVVLVLGMDATHVARTFSDA
jgi:Zn-dependent protease